MASFPLISGEKQICCLTCEDSLTKDLDPLEKLFARRFVVCSDCGNKRCPKATNHTLTCTGSNDPGQVGSIYE